MELFIIFLGSISCYQLKFRQFLSPVKASTLLTSATSLVIYDPILLALFYGGTFLGMSSPKKIIYPFFIVASIIFYFTHVKLNPLALGMGGTLGTMAFFSSGVTFFIFKHITHNHEQ